MPLTKENLIVANAEMLGNTNRGILFTTVNLSKDAPRLSKHLSDMAAGIYTWDQFRTLVKNELTVRSFPEFLEKFRPCFYYRLSPPKVTANVDLTDSAEAVGADETAAEVTEEGAGDAEGAEIDPDAGTVVELNMGAVSDAEEELSMANALPEYEFSLEGGPVENGWKRINITMDHPLFKNLSLHLKERALSSKTTVNVSVDSALWGFRPESQEKQLRKTAQDFKSSSKKLTLEMGRDATSADTRKALESYDKKIEDLENAIGDDLRVLPVIASGLAAARKALGTGGNANAGPNMGPYALEIGERGRLITRPALPSETIKGLDGAEASRAALEAGGNEIVLLSNALQSHPLAPRSVTEIVKLKDDDQYPALVGALMEDLVSRKKIQPVIGNMLAVILQDPKQLATWQVSPKEVEVFHDTFLGIYSMALDSFLRVIKPMFETLMGVYALFNEFPADVRRGQPELIITNDELTDLWQVYNEELTAFVRSACLQAANQYQDAISFAIVPGSEPLKDKAPAPPPSSFIRGGDFVTDFFSPVKEEAAKDVSKLKAEFDHLRIEGAGDTGGFGRIAGAPEVMGLMQLGNQCGFSVFFSPENLVIAGRVDAGDMALLQENYTPGTVVDKDWAVSGVLCLPDFVCLPPDGMLFTGKVMDGRSVGIEVPQIVVRSCYVAAGRYMANDNPDVLKSVINSLPSELRKTYKVRPLLPGLSADLTRFPDLGRTNLAPDHFLSDDILRTLLGRDKSFLVFSHVRTQPPKIAQPRTLRRERTARGEQYVMLHHWRQRNHLMRLLYAAYHLGGGGAWPTEDEMVGLMTDITNWIGWYDMAGEGYVNSFPSKLEGDQIVVDPVREDGEVVSFVFQLPFQAAVLGPLELSIE